MGRLLSAPAVTAAVATVAPPPGVAAAASGHAAAATAAARASISYSPTDVATFAAIYATATAGARAARRLLAATALGATIPAVDAACGTAVLP